MNTSKRIHGKNKLFMKCFCIIISIVLMVTAIPMHVNAATTMKKFIKADSKVFIPSIGETVTISWNFESDHNLNVMIMDGEQVIAYLAKDKKFKGNYEVQELTWDGMDKNGQLAEEGTYTVVVEPQEAVYKKYKSITNVTVIEDNTKEINISPYTSGDTFVVYGKGGKNQGVNKVTLIATVSGSSTKTLNATIGDNLWFASLPMTYYKLYDLEAIVKSTSGTRTIALNSDTKTNVSKKEQKKDETDGISLLSLDSNIPKLELKTHNMNTATGSAINNTLYPQFRIINTSNGTVNLSDITIRYYYTVDGEKPQNFFCDWSQAGAQNVTGKFYKMSAPIGTADYYLEVGFTAAAGTLEPGKSVETHVRIGKNDWSVFTPGNDYSQNMASDFTYFDQVDMFYKGNLLWGKESLGYGEESNPNLGEETGSGEEEPGEETGSGEEEPGEETGSGEEDPGEETGSDEEDPGEETGSDEEEPGDNGGSWEDPEEEDPEEVIPNVTNKLKLQMYNTGNSGDTANTIHPMMRLINNGGNMVKLSDITIRYYYTVDDDTPQNFWCDWSSAGQQNITGTFHTMEKKGQDADTYLEVGFKEGSGYIDIGADLDIHVRIAKNDWSNYDITNDYSINPKEYFEDWKKVDVFINGVKVWGEGVLPGAEEELTEEHIDYADTTYTPVKAEMFNTKREDSSNFIAPRFRIYNTGTEAIKLSDLRITYFYTSDGPEPQIFEADWAGIGSRFQYSLNKSDVICEFTEVGDDNLATNCVADIGFTRSDLTLEPGDYLELHTRIHRQNWTNYVQTNDYSLNQDSTDYEEWNKIAVFVKDRWAFGSLPLTYASVINLKP